MTTIPELIERMRKQTPAAVGKLEDRVAVRLLRAAFATVAADLEKAPDGAYKVGALGTFRVRTVKANAEGKGGGRRVLFKAQPLKVAAASPKP